MNYPLSFLLNYIKFVVLLFVFAFISTLGLWASALDTTGPYIMRDYPSELTSNSVVIYWTTSEPADGRIEYCTAPVHCGTFTATVPGFVLSHRIPITGLSPATRYYYWTYSRDSAGNLGFSGYRAFTTYQGIASSPASPLPTPIATPVPTPFPTPVPTPLPTAVVTPTPTPPTVTPAPTPAGSYGLAQNINLSEEGSMASSLSPYWWLNSGAYFKVASSIGQTNQGDLPAGDLWRGIYSVTNPVDTDGGAHPQNIFRLITTSRWTNYRQEGYFRINNYNLSSSPNRSAVNGILLLDRYIDSQNLYYAGIRVDGQAVISKKVNGAYHVLALGPAYPGTYSRGTNPILIPRNTYIGLRTEVRDNASGFAEIKLFIDRNNNGQWQLLLQGVDDGLYGPVFRGPGHAGIRTDFMDIYFRNYSLMGI